MKLSLLRLLLLLLIPGFMQPALAQGKTARVGILVLSEEQKKHPWHAEFISVLQERGWMQGKNLEFEYRYARGENLQFFDGAADLARLKVDVILASSAPAVRAMYAATQTIPIVALDYSTDPVAAGYVLSYSRPGKNITGVFLDAPELAGKWVDMLRALVPRLKRIAVLWDPSAGTVHLSAVQRAAKSFNLRMQLHEVKVPQDLEKAFAASRGFAQAIIVLPSPLTFTHESQLASLALKHKLPATSMFRTFAQAGGAIGYGPSRLESAQRNASQVARILDGAKPADLPIERPMKFDFVYNMHTMKALNLKVPDSLLLGAELVGK
ncbi:MAG: ABC transporter substrate-binding protein [Burkholderiales bacterium]